MRYTNIYQDIHLFLKLRDDHTFLMYGSGGEWVGLKNHMFCTVRKMQKYLDAPLADTESTYYTNMNYFNRGNVLLLFTILSTSKFCIYDYFWLSILSLTGDPWPGFLLIMKRHDYELKSYRYEALQGSVRFPPHTSHYSYCIYSSQPMYMVIKPCQRSTG